MIQTARILFTTVIIFISFLASAQYSFIIDGKVQQVETDSLVAETVKTKISNDLLAKGYLNYTLEKSDKQFEFILGPQYTFDSIKMSDEVKSILAASGYKLHLFHGAPSTSSSVAFLAKRVLSYLENQGYINAVMTLKNTSIIGDKVSTTIEIEKGSQILNDSLLLPNDNKISRQFLHKHLGIRLNKPFNASKFKNIESKINNLSYLKLKNKPDVNLINQRAEIVLDIEDVKASRFDFIIGVLPNTVQGKTAYKVIGEFTTEMNNLLGRGESFYAHIQRLQTDNQELDLRVAYPYLFNTSLITDAAFKLYRNGGDFIELKSNIGVNYAISDNIIIGGFVDYQSSRLIEIDSTNLVNTKVLPEKLDVSLSGVSFKLESRDLDYVFNPSSGYRLKLMLPFFRKRIIRNRSIESLSNDEVDFVAAYDSLQLNSVQLRPEFELDCFLPLTSRFVVKLGSRGGYIFNKNQIFENEYFRLGGHQLLRGFDELSITARGFAMLQAEMRLILNQNSFISLPFMDNGWVYRPGEDVEHAIGIGMGMNFGTPVGMFNITFASGKRRDLAFDFNNIKVHFGYISLF